MTMLSVQGLTVRYGAKTIVEDVSFEVREGEWVMLAGPNGAGKSTIAGALSQGVPHRGRIELGGQDVRALKPGQIARYMGVLAQSHAVGYSFTVEEVVALGRYAHSRGMLSAKSERDGELIRKALEMTGLEPLRGQSVLTLSGGELQRVFLAQVFAQDPKLLVLDEPTNHLDLKFQQQVFDLIRLWLMQPGRAVLSVVHDLSLARAYGSRAILLHRGRVVCDAPTQQAFTPENLLQVYDIDVYAWMRTMLGQWNQ
ncbi:MAG: ABC transporter ATP-binding protein [Eubacteriales bacterium]|nr:ABC transporter ATP-binding protein [Eubacteriales bacterium]